jgi:hypothetical protein
MMSKKNMLIIAGLAVGGLGVASMMAEDGGDAPLEQIRERAGNILGSAGETTTTTTTTGGEQAGYAKKDIFGAQPDVVFAAFPTDEDVFGQDPVVESQDKPAARRGGGGDFAYAESIPYPADVTKKESLITGAGKILGESYAAQGKGRGGLTSFRETKATLPSKVRGEPTPRISKKEGARAPVEAAIGYVSGGATGLWGAMSRSYATKGKGMSGSVKAVSTKKSTTLPSGAASTATALQRGFVSKGGFRGTGMTQDAYKSLTAHRTYSSPATAKGGFRGTGMTQDAYKSLTAHRTYSSPATAKKTSTDASKAISHAKRLRVGRGD